MGKKLNLFLNWVASFFSAQSDTSSKRLIAFVICVLYYKLNIDFSRNATESSWRFWQLILNAVVILLIIGVATIQDVMKFFKRFKSDENDTGTGEKTK